ncbi:MAG: PEP-CTERM sorting domain-containing protein [Planctomycetia bacterium]|nr:PEP-CTERM sorting domain-containing protein [Planctomycetia bacterium]
MWIPRKIYWMLGLMVAVVLVAASVEAAAPPVAEEDEPLPSLLQTTLTQTIAVFAQTGVLSPYARFKRIPPPDQPIPLVVRPPSSPPPDERFPTDPPPQLQETPEPGTVVTALIGGGLTLIAAWRKRRKSRQGSITSSTDTESPTEERERI